MKESISAYIALCNKSIQKWYLKNYTRNYYPDFTPVDKNNQEIIDYIYEMWLIVKTETKNKCMLLQIVKYYFAVSVVEYYLLYDMICFFNIGKNQMVEFSTNPALSVCRKKILGFNQNTYVFKHITSPYRL